MANRKVFAAPVLIGRNFLPSKSVPLPFAVPFRREGCLPFGIAESHNISSMENSCVSFLSLGFLVVPSKRIPTLEMSACCLRPRITWPMDKWISLEGSAECLGM